MATSLSTTLTLTLRHTLTNALDLSTPTDELTGSYSQWGDSMTNGTSTDQVNEAWHDERTLAATSETLDLTSGLTNPLGLALAFTGIKLLAIYNTTTTASANLTVGAAASNIISGLFGDSSDTIVIPPDGRFIWYSPRAACAVDATHKNLKLNSGASTIVYRIVIWGTKA